MDKELYECGLRLLRLKHYTTLHLYSSVFSVDADDCFNVQVRNGLLFCYNCGIRIGHFGKVHDSRHHLEIDNVCSKEFFSKSMDFHGGRGGNTDDYVEKEIHEINYKVRRYECHLCRQSSYLTKDIAQDDSFMLSE